MPSPLIIASRLPSSDGLYHLRYPGGNAPIGGAALASSPSVASAISAALSTGIKLGGIGSAASSATGALTTSGSSNPTPTGYSGSLTAGSTFTVTGSGFGSQGPTILLFEDFEGNTAGSKISLTAPYIGQWASYNGGGGSKQYLASSTAHTGSVSFNINDVGSITNGTGTQAAANILNLALGTQVEMFASYWTYTPGQQFCGEYGNIGSGSPVGTAPSAGQFSQDSCWKMIWVQKGLNDISGWSLVLPSYNGEGTFQIAGEEQVFIDSISNSWFSFTTWNRIATWIRGAPNATGSQSSGFMQFLNSQNGMTTVQFGTATTNPLFNAGGSGGTSFDNLNVPGYTAVASKTQLPLIDDIYITVGAGSVARVEIGDASTYTACQHMTILLCTNSSTNWSDGSVTCTVPRAGLDSSGPFYAYVTNANGVVNASGLLV